MGQGDFSAVQQADVVNGDQFLPQLGSGLSKKHQIIPADVVDQSFNGAKSLSNRVKEVFDTV